MKTEISPTVAFSSKLHPYLGESNENSFYSPFSIQVALGMTQAGAIGATAKALSDLLESPTDNNELKHFFKEMIRNTTSDTCELAVVNALWGQIGFDFKKKYISIIKEYFNGNFLSVNYIKKPQEAVNTINNWCNDNTKGKIPTIISINAVNDSTRLILTNAIYFKGKWEKEFNKKLTKNADFATPKGKKQVPMMYIKNNFYYYENSNLQAIDIPYKGQELAILVVLPTENNTSSIDANIEETYNQIINNLKYEEIVNVHLPKFKMSSEYSLKSPLSKLGAEIVFSDNADFSDISETNKLAISEVIHKAFVCIDEEGTEATAVTAVTMKCSSVRFPAKPKIFNANHPFLFFIHDSKNILFAGRITNPLKE